jgi:hypothetical protein
VIGEMVNGFVLTMPFGNGAFVLILFPYLGCLDFVLNQNVRAPEADVGFQNSFVSRKGAKAQSFDG